MMGLALVVGIVAGLGAITFHYACQFVVHHALGNLAGYHPHHPAGEPPLTGPAAGTVAGAAGMLRPWMLLLIPTIGGLVSGFLVFRLAPEAEGHGTDSAIAAFHFRGGAVRQRVPLVKLVSSAVTIGTGGSGGREGPIAQIGAGFGSLVGKVFGLRASDRRVLMAAGMGAGVAAIFRAPLAGALFAAEVLYCSADFESEVIVPAALASTAAYCTFGAVFGWSPLFAIPESLRRLMVFDDPRQLLFYALLALEMVLLAMLYTRSFYGISHLFGRLSLPRSLRPALGALAAGAIGVALYYSLGRDERVLSVLSFGYGSLQDALASPSLGEPALGLALLLGIIAIGKILTTGLTIGSGGSGGVFGPSMVIGGCGGGALGLVLHQQWPTLAPHPACFVVVGMAGFFAAAAKTPVSTLIIVSEMTGDYNLLLPTLWVCVLAFLLSDEQSLYHSQLRSRSLSPAHQGEHVREALAGTRVREFMSPVDAIAPLDPETTLAAAVERLAGSDGHHGLPVAGHDGRCLGMLGIEEVQPAARMARHGALVVAADLMRTDVAFLGPDDPIDRALELFVECDRATLPVVADGPGAILLGIVRRADISGAYLQRMHGDRPA